MKLMTRVQLGSGLAITLFKERKERNPGTLPGFSQAGKFASLQARKSRINQTFFPGLSPAM